MHCNFVITLWAVRIGTCFQSFIGYCAMTMARGELVDSTVMSYYHCISRCVRRAFLCGEGCEHRKQWIEDRLRELDSIFAVEVAAYAILDNHTHVVLKLNDVVAADWSDEDVVRRWGSLFPPRGKDRQPLEVSEDWVTAQLKDAKWWGKLASV